jgi:hypothetical protein
MSQYQHENEMKIEKEVKIQHVMLFNKNKINQLFIRNEIKKIVSFSAFLHMCTLILKHILNEILLMK